MKRIYPVVIIALILFSCTNGRISNLDHENDEVIVVGLVKVLYNGRDITSLSKIYFNESIWGTYRYSPRNHFIATKLPIGKNCIAGISFENKDSEFDHDYITFDLKDNKHINSLGNIEIRLYGSVRKQGSGVPMTELAFKSYNSGMVNISIDYNKTINQEIEKQFRRQFKSEIPIKKVEVKVDSFYTPRW